MKVLYIYPGMEPELAEIGNDLRSMQECVEGAIEVVEPFDDDIALVCNEEGKLDGSMPNRALYDSHGNLYDVVHGPFFLCGIGDDLEDFPLDLTEKYMERFALVA